MSLAPVICLSQRISIYPLFSMLLSNQTKAGVHIFQRLLLMSSRVPSFPNFLRTRRHASCFWRMPSSAHILSNSFRTFSTSYFNFSSSWCCIHGSQDRWYLSLRSSGVGEFGFIMKRLLTYASLKYTFPCFFSSFNFFISFLPPFLVERNRSNSSMSAVESPCVEPFVFS